MELGKKIYDLRKSKNLSQEQLASELNVSRQTISKWENNIILPDLDNIVLISNFFDISVDELLGKEKKENITTCQENGECSQTGIKRNKMNFWFVLLGLLSVCSFVIVGMILTSYLLNPVADATLIYTTTKISTKGIFISCSIFGTACFVIFSILLAIKLIRKKRNVKSE